MIAVTFALRDESAAFLRELYGARELVPGHLPVIMGRLGAEEILVCHTGMGAESVHRALPALGPHRLRAVVATGFAGALDPALAVGDIAVATNLSIPALLEVATELGALPRTFVTRESIIETRDDKERLARETGASIVDMESGAIAEYCRTRHLPLLAVRSVSDTARADFPVPGHILFDLRRQRPRPLALAAFLATHPSHIRTFTRFVADISKARRQLTIFLRQLLE